MSERDIVERLRAPAYWISGSSEGHDGENDAPLEAAAEILRLRGVLADARRTAWIAGWDAAADYTRALREESQRQFDAGLPPYEAIGVAALIASLRRHEKSIRKLEPPA